MMEGYMHDTGIGWGGRWLAVVGWEEAAAGERT